MGNTDAIALFRVNKKKSNCDAFRIPLPAALVPNTKARANTRATAAGLRLGVWLGLALPDPIKSKSIVPDLFFECSNKLI